MRTRESDLDRRRRMIVFGRQRHHRRDVIRRLTVRSGAAATAPLFAAPAVPGPAAIGETIEVVPEDELREAT